MQLAGALNFPWKIQIVRCTLSFFFVCSCVGIQKGPNVPVHRFLSRNRYHRTHFRPISKADCKQLRPCQAISASAVLLASSLEFNCTKLIRRLASRGKSLGSACERRGNELSPLRSHTQWHLVKLAIPCRASVCA